MLANTLAHRGTQTPSQQLSEEINTDFFPPEYKALFFNSVCKYRPDEASQKRLLGYY